MNTSRYTHRIVDTDGTTLSRHTSEAAAIQRRARMCKGRPADLLMLHVEPITTPCKLHPAHGGRSF